MVNELTGSTALRQSVVSGASEYTAPRKGDNAVVPVKNSEVNALATAGKDFPSGQQIDSQTPSDVVEAVQKMRDHMQVIDRDLHFSVDEDSGLTIVKVIDPETKEVVRQIPSEDIMRVVRSLESGGGLLSDVTA